MLRGNALFALLFATAWFRIDAVTVVETVNEDTQENRSSMLRSSYYRIQSEKYLHRLRKSFKAAITWAQDHFSDAIDYTGMGSVRRPIITGCLKECGYEEQSCVTQCQVCMEMNHCRILGNCEKCLGEARAMVLKFRRADKTILDSGGIAMVRDGLMAEMTEARLKALDMKRRLRSARENVLQAQREAEYAIQERHGRAHNLQEATKALKGSKQEVTRWKLQNEKKLKAARARAREQRQERQRAERKLEHEKRKYSKARRRLRDASNASAYNTSQDDAELWESTREVEERRQAVEDAEMQVEKTSADGEWLDRGLQRRVRSSERGAKKAREELLEGRARERVSEESLQEAKEKYMQATKASQRADEVAEEMEAKLRQAPLSEHPDAQAMRTGDDKDGSLKSRGFCAYFSLFLVIVMIGSSEWHTAG